MHYRIVVFLALQPVHVAEALFPVFFLHFHAHVCWLHAQVKFRPPKSPQCLQFVFILALGFGVCLLTMKLWSIHLSCCHQVWLALDNSVIFWHCRYIIPVPVINHFLSDVEETGRYVGFCSLGVTCQPTENVQLRDHLRSLLLSLSLTLWIYSCGSRKKVPQRIYFYLRDGVSRARTVSFSSNFIDVSLYPFTHNHCAICFCWERRHGTKCVLSMYVLHRMPLGLTGVLINKIHPLTNTSSCLQKDDVILAFDGTPIANDGTGRSRPSYFHC